MYFRLLGTFMSFDPDVPWDLVAQVRRSNQKSNILRQLDDGPMSATELSDSLGVKTATASNYLRELKNMNPPVVVCITPNQPHHRLYALTEDGEVVKENLKEP